MNNKKVEQVYALVRKSSDLEKELRVPLHNAAFCVLLDEYYRGAEGLELWLETEDPDGEISGQAWYDKLVVTFGTEGVKMPVPKLQTSVAVSATKDAVSKAKVSGRSPTTLRQASAIRCFNEADELWEVSHGLWEELQNLATESLLVSLNRTLTREALEEGSHAVMDKRPVDVYYT